MVAPRYTSSHPEGYVDSRYGDLKGNLGEARERIVKSGHGYQVKSEHGKNLSSKGLSKGAAKKRLAQVEYFKHKEGGPGSGPQGGGTDREIHNLSRSFDMVKDPAGRKVLQKRAKKLGDKVRAEYGMALSDKESKKPGWTGRQKDMHKEIGQQIAMESRGGSKKSGPVRLGPHDGEPDHPIDLRSISTQSVVREGWHGGMSYSPPVSRIKKETEAERGVVVKEF